MSARDEGYALIAVLVMVAVTGALAALALTLANTGVASAVGYAAELEGGHAATAAVRLTAIRLADAEGHTILSAQRTPIDWMGWTVTVGIEDEAGKQDLNRTPRSALARSLRVDGLPAAIVARALDDPERRFTSVDEIAGLLQVEPAALADLRRRYTVYGGDVPQPAQVRSSLETYRIVAVATRGDRRVVRWAIVRLSPGFGMPFEWLERGQDGDDFKVSRK